MPILQDLRFAVRMLLKDPWFTSVAALALALGIGVNTTVFTFVNAVLIRGLPFDRSDEIVLLATRNTTRGADNASTASWHEFEDWRSKARTFAGIGAFIPGQMNVSDPDHPAERISGASISANTFGLLRVQPFLGRDFATGEDVTGATPVVILGYNTWKNRYGSDRTVIGRTLKINELSHTIIGVMPEGMRFPTNADLWRPMLKPAAAGALHQRNIGVFARLAPGATWSQAAAEMRAISTELQSAYPENNKNIEARLMTFNERFNGGPIRVIFLALLGAVGFVLLIACANVANLLLARSAYRAREMAVRTALGASRGRIVRQLLIESVMLASIGGLIGLLLAYGGVALFDRAVSDVGKPYWIVFRLDLPVFGYFAAICLATGIIFGLAPALQVSKANLNELMKEGGRGTAGGARARWLTSTLVVAELTLTLALLTGAGLMARSFLKLYSLDLGVETDHVLTMRTQLVASKYPKPEQRQVFFDQVEQRLRAIPGVSGAAVTTSLPLDGAASFPFEIEGKPASEATSRPRVLAIDTSPAYFDTMGVGLLRGRAFTAADGPASAEVVIVNQQLATRLFPGEDPLGRRLRLMTGQNEDQPGAWMTIVGVSPTIRQGDVQALDPGAVVYRPSRMTSPMGSAVVIRTTVDPATLTSAVREAARTIDADQPFFQVQTLNENLIRARWPYRVFGTLFVIFAVIALVLSSVGIYAITAYAVTQRTQEIGVRLALGAQPAQISWLILRTGLVQLTIGLALGLLGAWGVSLVLRSIVAQIPATDPITFVSITLLLTIVTVIACLIPARRATRLDPLVALRID
ncbi:MAG TPA: ABC transporter permease [Vicinamibacterales bacterium]|nr:ABC transporter permease [Vicinamibacterales bacterium]